MKNLFHRLLSSLNIGGRDWVVLLLALLLAFSTWLIHNLSLRYNDYLRVSVVARCNIEGHADVSANKCEVIARCRTTGYKVINVDATVLAQAPKLAPYIFEMRKNVAMALGLSISDVSIKATTEEGLGFTGEKLGIAAHAVCLIDNV